MELLYEIANRLRDIAQRIIVVNDPDGLLITDAVRNQLERLIGFPIIVAEDIALRVHFELNVRRDTAARVCYVRRCSVPLLWDIAKEARIISISVAELFPNFIDRQTMASLDFHTLEILYAKHIQGRVDATKLQSLIKDNSNAAEPIVESPMDTLRRCADAPDWSDTKYAETLGKTLKQLIARREYDDDAAKLIYDINFDFQHYLQDSYFATLNSSGEPTAVHAVAPFMQHHFGTDDKLAFIVVDGMAWWQWEVLRDVLEQEKLLPMPEVKAIFAWLPSITALSRQALFRGATPKIDYRQTPGEEEKLWKQMWKGNPVFAPVYLHGENGKLKIENEEFSILNYPFSIPTRRLALVDVQLDKKMHQSSDYYDLHDLTHNWAIKFAQIIARLKREDFKIVLTTDHGNVLAQGVGTLKPEEKVHLYLANSRGERFVYFKNGEWKMENGKLVDDGKRMRDQFRDKQYMMRFFCNPRETWLAIGDNASFSTSKKQLITHGGSHFLETIIPMVIIE